MSIFHFLCTTFGQNPSARFCAYRKTINSFWLRKKNSTDFLQELYTKDGKKAQFWVLNMKVFPFFVYNFCQKSFGTFFCIQTLFIDLRYSQKRADGFWPKKPDYVHKKWKMDIYIKENTKVVRTNFLWVLNFDQVGGPDVKIQKHPLGWIFLKSY